jgi:hypothetical protein
MKIQFVLFLVVIFLINSCSNDDDRAFAKQELYNNGTVKIELLNINDGRCPSDAVCLWEGNAEVFLKITDATTSVDYSLNTFGIDNINNQVNYPSSIQVLNTNVTLLDLQPLPLNGVTYSLSDYTVTIDVQ